ncbi:hypothetical protein E0H68_06295 [Rhizobium leguminosarum bv. viciae]|uniref:hypothetical protein n=1 Tax=Rhizobium leguminosarum TaxID=384 RepID=UPI0010403FAA|nr:hypothetical protein [Rhizobium leguminosarum]TCA17381.1 hypothetical protein E0H68_06295 [Rhizobium leguminosarum bv. viciae]
MTAFTQADRDGIWSVLENGGSYTTKLAENEMTMSDDVIEALGDTLHTGFVMPPTSLIYLDEAATKILHLADGWTAVPVRVYRRGGSITYKKLPSGEFEATINI